VIYLGLTLKLMFKNVMTQKLVKQQEQNLKAAGFIMKRSMIHGNK